MIMSKAFKCERCGEFKDGTGIHLRIGTYMGTIGISENYNFHRKNEVCSDCKKKVFEEVDKIMEDFDNE